MAHQHSVMAIINITCDSFYAGSRTATKRQIALRAEEAVAHGATILDLGGYSTRPGAADVTSEEELARLSLALSTIRTIDPQVNLSIDTFRSEIVERVYDQWGSVTVNDISAGEIDSRMIPLVGRLKLPYIAMHMRGTPQTMQSMASYENIVQEVREFFVAKIEECHSAGITDLMIDPGFGFAKSTEHNFELLRSMHLICDLGVPLLAGLSRKSMIWRTLGVTPSDALIGTAALNWEALRQGATVLRVHDVKEAVEVIKLFNAYHRPHTL